MRLLLKGGRVIDPSRDMDDQMDVLVEKGKIAKLGKNISDDSQGVGAKGQKGDLEIINVQDLLVVPGLIDIHCHLREPGFEYKETIQTGSEAAAAGGFTSVACMANTDPVHDNRSVTEFIRQKVAQSDLINVFPVASISVGLQGQILTEFIDLKNAGAVAFSDDGKPVMNSALMRRALEYAYSIGMPVISHCEDANLSNEGVMNESFVATELGLSGIPSVAEEMMVARDILLAQYTRTAVHLAHVSTAGSVQIIRDAKNRGVKVTAETAPHYFTLTEEFLRDYNPNMKVNPPLRSSEDREALKQGLRDGTIDVIATDHAPHARTDKEVEFEYAASGIVGLETSLPLSLRLVEEGVVTWKQLIAMMSFNPARILKIPKGTLKAGADADITVVDLNKKWTVSRDTLHSRSKNTPFDGWEMKGKAVLTVVGGKIKHREL
jgi:dihydroorotase